MTTPASAATRQDLTFTSGGDLCAAWHYAPPADGGGGTCIVMAHGFSLTRHDGLEQFAQAFAAAGSHVLVFDHRHLGDSGGEPRQRFRRGLQLEDWRNAVAFARSLDGVAASRIVLWGFSFSGGHAVTLAAARGAEPPAAVLVLCPFVEGLRRVIATPPALSAWILPRSIADLAGRDLLIPVTGEPGSHAAMTLPGEADGFAATVPPGSPWRNEISPGIFASVAFVRPLTRARRIACPLWVGLGERDVSVHAGSVAALAERAPRGELHRYDVDHFGAFHGADHEQVVADQVDFLRRSELL